MTEKVNDSIAGRPLAIPVLLNNEYLGTAQESFFPDEKSLAHKAADVAKILKVISLLSFHVFSITLN